MKKTKTAKSLVIAASEDKIIENFGEDKEYKNNPVMSKFTYDLFNEEKNTIEKVIRVRHFKLPNKGERWRIFENNKNIFTVEGVKVSKKEREFLRTAEGFQFLILQTKKGINSFNHLRQELKAKLKTK